MSDTGSVFNKNKTMTSKQLTTNLLIVIRMMRRRLFWKWRSWAIPESKEKLRTNQKLIDWNKKTIVPRSWGPCHRLIVFQWNACRLIKNLDTSQQRVLRVLSGWKSKKCLKLKIKSGDRENTNMFEIFNSLLCKLQQITTLTIGIEVSAQKM